MGKREQSWRETTAMPEIGLPQGVPSPVDMYGGPGPAAGKLIFAPELAKYAKRGVENLPLRLRVLLMQHPETIRVRPPVTQWEKDYSVTHPGFFNNRTKEAIISVENMLNAPGVKYLMEPQEVTTIRTKPWPARRDKIVKPGKTEDEIIGGAVSHELTHAADRLRYGPDFGPVEAYPIPIRGVEALPRGGLTAGARPDLTDAGWANHALSETLPTIAERKAFGPRGIARIVDRNELLDYIEEFLQTPESVKATARQMLRSDMKNTLR